MSNIINSNLTPLPDWITALIGGLITFITKTLYDKYAKKTEDKKNVKSRLILFQELLRESKATFISQVRLRDELAQSLSLRFSDDTRGYNDFFSQHYNDFNSDEKELFDIMRSITENSMRNVNQRLLDWINDTIDIRVPPSESHIYEKFKNELHELKDHLLLWLDVFSQFEKKSTKCLVYLGDEHAHGKEFPHSIEESIVTIIKLSQVR